MIEDDKNLVTLLEDACARLFANGKIHRCAIHITRGRANELYDLERLWFGYYGA